MDEFLKKNMVTRGNTGGMAISGEEKNAGRTGNQRKMRVILIFQKNESLRSNEL